MVEDRAKKDGNFDKYVHVAPNVTNIFLMWFNENRQVYANVPDGACVSSKTEEQKEVSRAALQNQHFRLALACNDELEAMPATGNHLTIEAEDEEPDDSLFAGDEDYN